MIELVATAGRLYRNPVNSLLTAMVIGITLALPAGLHVALKNLNALSYGWQGSASASLFLAESVSETAGRRLADEIATKEGVAGTEYISRQAALAEFKRLSGFGEALAVLEENPLPAVIAVTPADGAATTFENLVGSLADRPEVAEARLDQAWLQRLFAILAIVQRAVAIIAILLGLAVVFIVGNTIRLDIENRREQIEVMKLLGATDAFIRRPFLYTGFWYGLIGGLVALMLMGLCLLALAGPVRRLTGLYGAEAGLAGLSAGESLLVIAAGVALGWLGSAWTVNRHLRAIKPR